MNATHTPNYEHMAYMEHSIRTDRLQTILAMGVPILKEYDFDAFAFRGMSGALLASPFALAMNKTLLLVRKQVSDCHSTCWVEGDFGARRYVIIDDFISTGVTVRKILAEVEAVMPEAECIGILEVANLFDVEPCDIVTPGFERKFRGLTQLVQEPRQLL